MPSHSHRPPFERAIARAADRRACRDAIRQGSRSFYAASLLLGQDVRDPAYAIYAFCRKADDAVDEGAEPLAAVRDLRARLDLAYAGHPVETPGDRAFAEVVASFGIPRALPEALLEGLAWDTTGQRYETLADVRAYAVRVAASVGAMMAVLMGRRDPVSIARACDLGVAMQLTNIARDVGADAALGRIYLPEAWLREAGIDPEAWLARPEPTPALRGVVARLLDVAEVLYVRSESGIAVLPASCRPGIFAARILYAEIGAEVARRGHDSVSGRAVVKSRRQVALLGRALTLAAQRRAVDDAPPLPEAAYLVDAVSAHAHAAAMAGGPPWWDVGGGFDRGLEMLMRVQARADEREQPAPV